MLEDDQKLQVFKLPHNQVIEIQMHLTVYGGSILALNICHEIFKIKDKFTHGYTSIFRCGLRVMYFAANAFKGFCKSSDQEQNVKTRVHP